MASILIVDGFPVFVKTPVSSDLIINVHGELPLLKPAPLTPTLLVTGRTVRPIATFVDL